jgi:hypothetical protein
MQKGTPFKWELPPLLNYTDHGEKKCSRNCLALENMVENDELDSRLVEMSQVAAEVEWNDAW